MSDPRKMAILAPNFTAGSYSATVDSYTAGTVPTLMPTNLLLTDEPADRSRLLTHDPVDTYWHFRFGDGTLNGIAPRVLSGLGLVNVNLSRFGKYRFVGIQGGIDLAATPPYERLAPTAELASVNATGAVTNVDESPRSPDGLWVTPTAAGSNWSKRYAFNTPALPPVAGVDRNAFVLWARRQGTATQRHPILNVQLLESGAVKADLGTRVVSQAGGQILIFRWNAALLTLASGANVEIYIEGRSDNVNCNVELGAVAWDAEPSFAGVPWDHDSGWLSSPFDATSASWGGTAADDVGALAPVRTLAYLPASPWLGVDGVHGVGDWLVMLSDDQSDNTYTGATVSAPATRIKAPDGYAQAGVAVASAAFVPSILNFAKGPFLGTRDPSIKLETLGGQEGGSRRRPRRVMPVTLDHLTDAEGYSLFDRVDWRKGSKLPMLVVKFPDGDAASQLATLWCTLESPQGLTRGVPNKQGWAGTFVEKL